MLKAIEKELFENGFWNFLIYFIFIFVVTTILNASLNKLQKVVHEKNGAHKNTAFRYLFKTLRTVMFAVAAFLVFSEIKPMRVLGTALLGATSLVAVIVGLAAQESFGNYISGFFIALYEPFHLGDSITLPDKNITGKVKEINFRHIVLETVNNSNVIIPNSTMNSTIIENRTGHNYKNKIYVSVTYDTDIDSARSVIQKVVAIEEKNIGITNDQCNVFVENLNESSVDLCFYVEGKSVSESYSAACKVREEILKEFRKENIQMAFPTRTVYIAKDNE